MERTILRNLETGKTYEVVQDLYLELDFCQELTYEFRFIDGYTTTQEAYYHFNGDMICVGQYLVKEYNTSNYSIYDHHKQHKDFIVINQK